MDDRDGGRGTEVENRDATALDGGSDARDWSSAGGFRRLGARCSVVGSVVGRRRGRRSVESRRRLRRSWEIAPPQGLTGRWATAYCALWLGSAARWAFSSFGLQFNV